MLDEIERCKEFLEPVFEKYNTYNWEDVEENIKKGRWYLLIEIIKYPRKKTLYILGAGGELDQILKAQEDLERIARKQGCKDIEIRGRKGWERLALKFEGYKTHYVVINKEL